MAKRRIASPITIHTELARAERELLKKRVYCEQLKNLFVKTIGEEGKGPSGGMAFTQKAAKNFTEYVKSAVRDQSAFNYSDVPGMSSPVPPVLDPTYVEYKKRKLADKGVIKQENVHKFGIATEQMVNAIKPIDMGTGTWRVGIPKGTMVSTVIGNIKDISIYAEILEMGRKKQSPRPWLLPTFWKWVDEKLPDYVEKDLHGPISDILGKLSDKMSEFEQKTRPEEYYSSGVVSEEEFEKLSEAEQEAVRATTGGPSSEYAKRKIKGRTVYDQVSDRGELTKHERRPGGMTGGAWTWADEEEPKGTKKPAEEVKDLKEKGYPQEVVGNVQLDKMSNIWIGIANWKGQKVQVVWDAKVAEAWLEYETYLKNKYK